jgi:hypothetical protein
MGPLHKDFHHQLILWGKLRCRTLTFSLEKWSTWWVLHTWRFTAGYIYIYIYIYIYLSINSLSEWNPREWNPTIHNHTIHQISQTPFNLFLGVKKNQPWWLLKPTMATPGGPSGNDDQGDKVRTEFGFLLDRRNLSVILPSLGWNSPDGLMGFNGRLMGFNGI